MNRTWLTLAAVLVGALAFRIAFCVVVVGFHDPLRGDEPDYHDIAVNIADGNGFVKHVGLPTAMRPPLYPALLGGVYAVFGKAPENGRVLQLLLGTLTVLLVFLLGRAAFNTSVGLWGAALAAVNPFLVFMSSYLMTENLFIVLLLAGLLLVAPDADRRFPSVRRLFLGGLFLGLAALARPNGLVFVALAALLVMLFRAGSLRPRLLGAAALVLGALLVIAPWTVRNTVRLGEPVLISTNGGIVFYESNNPIVLEEPIFHGGIIVPRTLLPGYEELLQHDDEVGYSREAGRMAWEYLRENPGAAPVLAWRKFVRLWRFQSDMGLSGVKGGFWWGSDSWADRLISNVDFGLMFNAVSIPLFLVGLGLSLRRRRAAWVLLALVAAQTLTAMVFFGSLRFRLPAEPMVALFGAYAIVAVREWRARRIRSRGAAAGA